MSLKEQMETGKVYVEFGHADPADQSCEQQLEAQRQLAKSLCYDYNQTRPTDLARKAALLKSACAAAAATQIACGSAFPISSDARIMILLAINFTSSPAYSIRAR